MLIVNRLFSKHRVQQLVSNRLNRGVKNLRACLSKTAGGRGGGVGVGYTNPQYLHTTFPAEPLHPLRNAPLQREEDGEHRRATARESGAVVIAWPVFHCHSVPYPVHFLPYLSRFHRPRTRHSHSSCAFRVPFVSRQSAFLKRQSANVAVGYWLAG